MIECSGCGTSVHKLTCHKIFNYIYYCPLCVRKILIIHTYTHDIKFLCPHCENNSDQCKYCSPDALLQTIEDDEEEETNEI